MPMYYRRPGVYLEESLLVNPSDVASTFTVAAFIGVAEKGPINEPVYVQSWNDYTTIFGGFNTITQPNVTDPNDVSARLLAAVPPSPIPANLAALKAHAVYGDGKYGDPAGFNGLVFGPGQYVKLGDGSLAHYKPNTTAGIWSAGKMAGTGVANTPAPKILSYLPYSVFSFFQNGGRVCWVVRAAPVGADGGGIASSIAVNGSLSLDNLASFTLSSRSPGAWGNGVKYALATQGDPYGDGEEVPLQNAFALQIILRNSAGDDEVVETFPALSVSGDIPGTRRVDTVLNDPTFGSRYVRASGVNELQLQPRETDPNPVALVGGVDPEIPDSGELTTAAGLISKVEGPVAVNVVGYLDDASMAETEGFSLHYVGATVSSSAYPDRQDIIVINDSAKPREPRESSSDYISRVQGPLSVYSDSYQASYLPWIVIPHPTRAGTTVTVPPGGGIVGMMARIDSTVGVFRAPAGVIAGLANAVGVQTKFTDTELGALNAGNINVVRSVLGSGICVMGGRTRKSYGADRYISARRTLIYIKESLKRSTQWAVFENNDQRLWSGLRMSADRILRPMWLAGGLAGFNTGEAYYITCDDTINTPPVIQSGEVRMEVGVALEYPAEFVVIRITQFDRGTFSAEVQPIS